MAVTQISRVQQRRGLQQDLPQLASAEFGWSLDQRRLFIGNGTIAEGAPSEGVTEILTQYSNVIDIIKNYTLKGQAAGYVLQSGPATANPVKRFFQDKLDDIINVRDFGAVGDGRANDTDAINRAIRQVYLHSRVQTQPATRRTIYFPAGVYLISGDVIRIPPWLRIIGDGIESTIIRQTDVTQECVILFSDSKLQTGGDLGRFNATLANNVNIESLTLHHDHERDVAVIESTDSAVFRLVAFTSSVTDSANNPSFFAGVKLRSSKQTTKNINFEFCKFSGLRYHIVADDTVSNIKVNGSSLRGGWRSFSLGRNSTAGSTIKNVRITNSNFQDIAAEAIRGYDSCVELVSTGNSFDNVGTALNGTENYSAIKFAQPNNYSIADSFQVPGKKIVFEQGGVELNYQRGLTLGTLNVGTGQKLTLVTTSLDVRLTTGVKLPQVCQVNYRLSRGTAIQTGTILFTNTGSEGPKFTENFHTAGAAPIGIELGFQNDELAYTVTATGDTATLSYNITQL